MIGRRRTVRPDVSPKLAALVEARELGEGRVADPLLARADGVIERAGSRRALSADHTVVGFFGATGSGKSSLFNAVAGQQLARVAARRPTTGRPLAAVWGSEGSRPLLDWLEVSDRRIVDDEGDRILLDLPDFDSVERAHREIAQRMTGMVDVLVWVLDPQKYADAVVHRDFIRPFSAHGAVTLVVLNQIDLIAERDRDTVLRSLEHLLARDGLTDVRVLATSATTRDGVAELRAAIAEFAARKEAAVQRLLVDVTSAAGALEEAAGASAPAGVRPAAVQDLTDGLGKAAQVDVVVDAVGRSYRRRAGARTGWPPVRWLRRVRVDPLERLNIGQQEAPEQYARTSLPSSGATGRAHTDRSVRAFADDVSAGAPEAWRASIRRAARSREEELPDALDQAVATTDLKARTGSWWWPLFDVLQWLALAAVVIGLGWLALLAVLGYFQIPTPEMIMVEGLWVPLPLPTVLVALGLALGILLALVGGAIGALSASFRERRARRRLRAAVGSAADRLVVEPVRAEVERCERFRSALEAAR